MIESLIGIVGILVGMLLSEYFRRERRIEGYSKEVFQRRIEVYEGLHKKLLIADGVASHTAKFEPQEEPTELRVARQAIIQVIIEYLDENELYLNEDLTVHAALTILGIQKEIAEAESPEAREQGLEAYWRNSKTLKQMIRKDAGLEELDRLFSKVTRARLDSEYIALWREVKARSTRKLPESTKKNGGEEPTG